jgi:hypothetical protein
VARQNIISRAIVNYDGDSHTRADKSYERTLFGGERVFQVRIVAFGLVPAGPFDVLHRMNQVAVRDHGMMGGFFKLSGCVTLGGTALVPGSVLEQFGGFQMMIHALLRHALRITNGIANLKSRHGILNFELQGFGAR